MATKKKKPRNTYKTGVTYSAIAAHMGMGVSNLSQLLNKGMDTEQREMFLNAFIELSNNFLGKHNFRIRFAANKQKEVNDENI